MAMKNQKWSIKKLIELKNIGIKLSLDDFGTGYSSLAYLKELPIDFLKIDKSFVKDIISDNSNSVIVQAIIFISHSLGIPVVAEGVETKEQLEKLMKFNCDVAQGYYFSKPVPPVELEELLVKQLG
jgi:EAL domain-containing protein (putative c-di-GMP-specific phosphodiesterase class I)